MQGVGNNLQKPCAKKQTKKKRIKMWMLLSVSPRLTRRRMEDSGSVLVCFCECRTMCKEVHTPVNYAEVVKLSQCPV